MENIKEYEAMAKLDLSEAERCLTLKRADVLIDSFVRLEGVNTSGVEPLITVLDIKNVFREDDCVKMMSREELLANAPEQYDGFFLVPKTLD